MKRVVMPADQEVEDASSIELTIEHKDPVGDDYELAAR